MGLRDSTLTHSRSQSNPDGVYTAFGSKSKSFPCLPAASLPKLPTQGQGNSLTGLGQGSHRLPFSTRPWARVHGTGLCWAPGVWTSGTGLPRVSVGDG